MSDKDMWAVIARAQSDSDFAARLFSDFAKTAEQDGFSLTPQETEKAKKMMGGGNASQAPPLEAPKLQDFQNELRFKAEKERERLSAHETDWNCPAAAFRDCQ